MEKSFPSPLTEKRHSVDLSSALLLPTGNIEYKLGTFQNEGDVRGDMDVKVLSSVKPGLTSD